jgi:hypothetical protein
VGGAPVFREGRVARLHRHQKHSIVYRTIDLYCQKFRKVQSLMM